MKLRFNFRSLSRLLPPFIQDFLVMVLFLVAAYLVSDVLLKHTGVENNSALVYVLAVALTAFCCSSRLYGFLASIISSFCVNYYFMYPYFKFNFTLAGYPVAFVSMLCIALLISAMTTQIKIQAKQAMERERHTQELATVNQQLYKEKVAAEIEAAKESVRSNILRAVSHDLRTPLTSISGAVSVMLENEKEAGRTENISFLEDIKKDSEWLIAMVENLLSITRIQGAGEPLKKRTEVLEEVVADAVRKIQRRFPECKVATDYPEEILLLPMEPMLIQQVVVNLLENAIRHSGDKEHIQVAVTKEQDYAVVSVTDRGKGLKEETIAKIQSGQQLLPNQEGDSTRGMGIGLSVCQSIIKAHEGFFEVKNREEGGAEFRFGLPMEDMSDENNDFDRGR
ncbi:MAG: DUF4118 domain-containing protein [Clostridiales bacterium]|nr:DUF4118 domain-containing protein [Clostridiales bacterium]